MYIYIYIEREREVHIKFILSMLFSLRNICEKAITSSQTGLKKNFSIGSTAG